MENENSLPCLQEPVIASHCGLHKSSSTASQSVIKSLFSLIFYFKGKTLGIWDHHAVCEWFVPPTFQLLNHIMDFHQNITPLETTHNPTLVSYLQSANTSWRMHGLVETTNRTYYFCSGTATAQAQTCTSLSVSLVLVLHTKPATLVFTFPA